MIRGLCFASERYWTSLEELNRAYMEIAQRLERLGIEAQLVRDERDAETAIQPGECAVLVPMSGAVQSWIIAAAAKFKFTIVYAAYVRGNIEAEIAALLTCRNAAPALMECWAVIKRGRTSALLALDEAQLDDTLHAISAYQTVRGAKLLLAGGAEKWVMSTATLERYAELGFNIEWIPQTEIAACFHEMHSADGDPYYQHFTRRAKSIAEPNDADIRTAARMAAALEQTLRAHNAAGMALACFNLLSEGTNCCLGVSYINEMTELVVACEGDLDSAITLLLLKQLANTRLFMANPGLQPGGIINFNHCTAPLDPCGCGANYILRNHHESGIGVSIQSTIPVCKEVTACRYSGVENCITVATGHTVTGEYEHACRTQVFVKLDDFDRYIDTALGCHQVLTFENIDKRVRLLARLLGIPVK